MDPFRSGWLGMASLIHSYDCYQLITRALWLVGNGLSDTLQKKPPGPSGQLWLVGNGLSDTLSHPNGPAATSALAGWEWPL